MNPLYHFFCWCSGARLYILKQCPSEYNKYFGIGAVVLMTGVMAAVTGAFALFTVFENYVIAVILGLFWGLLIFSLDWYIVASLKKEKKFIKEMISAIPRLILGLMIAVVISKPLELKLFEKEIEKEMTLMNQELKSDYNESVRENFSQIDALRKENSRYRREIEKKEEERQKLFEMMIAEAEGRSPTNIKGKGPVYEEKKEEFEKVDQEYQALKERNLEAIQKNNEIIAELRQKQNEQIYSRENETFIASGFLGQMKALNSLTKKEPSVRYANWFIILLFIVIESAPIIVKLMSGRGPYDELLEALEKEKNLNTQKYLNEVRLAGKNSTAFHTDLSNTLHSEKLASEKKHIEDIYRVKRETDEEKVQSWKKEELDRIKKAPEKYIEEIRQYLYNDLRE
jgi:hypothetical protein